MSLRWEGKIEKVSEDIVFHTKDGRYKKCDSRGHCGHMYNWTIKKKHLGKYIDGKDLEEYGMQTIGTSSDRYLGQHGLGGLFSVFYDSMTLRLWYSLVSIPQWQEHIRYLLACNEFLSSKFILKMFISDIYKYKNDLQIVSKGMIKDVAVIIMIYAIFMFVNFSSNFASNCLDL